MNEYEQIILDLDLSEIQVQLLNKGATLIADTVQKQYNFDFNPIYFEFTGSIGTLSKENLTTNEKYLVINKLQNLINDTKDLCKETGIQFPDELVAPNFDFSLESFKKYGSLFQSFAINPNKWARIKLLPDSKVSIAVKQIFNRKRSIVNGKEVRTHKVEDVKEVEVIADSFDGSLRLMKELGYFPKSYTERRRITYQFSGSKIEIDIYPHVPPFLEVESESKVKVYDTIRQLGLQKNLELTFNKIGEKNTMNHDDIYSLYDLNIEKSFSLIPKEQKIK